MDKRKFMTRKSISYNQSVENISDERLKNEVQPAQTNVSTTNVVLDSSSPIQTQMSAVHNNNDVGLYANSAKSVKDESTPFSQTRTHLHAWMSEGGLGSKAPS